jgi:hypothetical protein
MFGELGRERNDLYPCSTVMAYWAPHIKYFPSLLHTKKSITKFIEEKNQFNNHQKQKLN